MAINLNIDTERMGANLLPVLRELSHPLVDDCDLDPLLDRIGDAHYVLLGEASHGTSDFYTWRARLTKRLLTEKDFSFVDESTALHPLHVAPEADKPPEMYPWGV
ncbi:MAG TPA: hypothetical protein P5121_27705 [Caldilineaceae bacterium]|nr:hypothetical protein [Caldilineaceae bacterium]